MLRVGKDYSIKDLESIGKLQGLYKYIAVVDGRLIPLDGVVEHTIEVLVSYGMTREDAEEYTVEDLKNRSWDLYRAEKSVEFLEGEYRYRCGMTVRK